MSRHRSLVAAPVIILLLMASGLLQHDYDRHRHYFADRNVFVSLPSGKTLRILSFGFTNFIADLIYLWAIQFYSSTQLNNRYDYIESIFNTITDMTPDYREVYTIGSLIMVYEKNDIAMALRLLDKGSANLPQEWIFDLDAGYYCYKYLKNYSQAESYYGRAAQKPDAPNFIKRNQAHMVYLRDDPEVSFRMWLDIYQNARDTMERDSAFNHLYQIKSEIDRRLLGERIRVFRDRYGRLPRNLAELVQRGLLDKIPVDFGGGEYRYDPASGQVKAGREFRWKKF